MLLFSPTPQTWEGSLGRCEPAEGVGGAGDDGQHPGTESGGVCGESDSACRLKRPLPDL